MTSEMLTLVIWLKKQIEHEREQLDMVPDKNSCMAGMAIGAGEAYERVLEFISDQP